MTVKPDRPPEPELTVAQRVKLMEKLTEQLADLVQTLAADREKAERALGALRDLSRSLRIHK